MSNSTVTNKRGKTAMIRARTEPNVKAQAEKILEMLGINSSEAINLFYSQIILRQGLPFEVKIPNRTTEKVFRDTDRRRQLMKPKNLPDMFHKLGL
jgi:DNA-damage-inducible protein J